MNLGIYLVVPVVKNPPANGGDPGLIPGHRKYPILCGTNKPTYHIPHTTTTEPACLETCASQQKKIPQ